MIKWVKAKSLHEESVELHQTRLKLKKKKVLRAPR